MLNDDDGLDLIMNTKIEHHEHELHIVEVMLEHEYHDNDIIDEVIVINDDDEVDEHDDLDVMLLMLDELIDEYENVVV